MVGDKKSVAMLDENGKVIGAVSKSGDTMTGNLVVSRAAAARVDVNNTEAGRTARLQANTSGYAEFGNVGENGYVTLVLDKESGAIESLAVLNKTQDGKTTKYNLFGEHNLTALRDALKAIW